ncbi:hypothetical protein UFOVP328_290 [uncultured Caudovirales phage]|uniref:Uncharacterized protein n=1 Tax=uncultured Caudovirales phage TaxID=2100421 RepID=A0A6J5LYE8_9CAUD|nr:hypothetical protein UFOVP328_290 [uncultured Caudovirales phage]
MAQQTSAKQLFDLLVSRNFSPELLDSAGKPASDPAETEVFSFDFVTESGNNYGTVVIMLGDTNDLEVFFGDNVGRTMEGPDKNEWYDFLEQLKHFSTKNLMGFGLKNLNRLRYSMQGQAAIKEGLFESWRGTKTVSYNDRPEAVRLMIKHKKPIGEGDARYRYVESLYVETTDGERFKLPFTKLSGGRAMVEHVRNGGRPYDLVGQHIAGIVEELNVLSRFRRANHGKIFEGDTEQLVAETNIYYENLNRVLKALGTKRGYSNYFESWNPSEITEQDVVIEGIKNLFVRETIDTRIEQALPVLAKIQKQGQAMKEINMFEAWANRLTEGTWATPETPEQKQQLVDLLSKDFPVGADALNATEQLYDLLGDDQLFDQLQNLADQDANADARQTILDRMIELGQNPDVAEVIAQLNIDTDPADQLDVDVDVEAVDEAGGIPGNVPAGQVPGKEKLLKTPATKPQSVASKIKDTLGGLKDFVTGKEEDPTRPTYEADNLSTFEGQCSMTAEGENCPVHGLKECNMEEDLDTDGVMMTKASNMSSESVDPMLSRMKSLAGIIVK